jgi:N-formylmaleamate deformylase
MRIRARSLGLAVVFGLGFGFGACGGSSAQAPQPPAPPAPPAFQPKSFSVTVSGAGRPVIFIPGLTCDGSIWDGTVAHLGGRVQAHVLSLAGFAGRPAIDAPLLPTARDEIIAYIKANRLDHPLLVGHSLGGFLTFWIAETAPELLGGGVAVDGASYVSALVDPNVAPATAKAQADRFVKGFEAMSPEVFSQNISQFLGTMMSKPDDVARIGPLAAKSDPKTTLDAMKLMFTTDLRPDLGKVTVPIVEIAADGLYQTPRERLEATWHAQIDAIPRHELVIIEKSKHFVMLDQPEAFYAALDKIIFAK